MFPSHVQKLPIKIILISKIFLSPTHTRPESSLSLSMVFKIYHSCNRHCLPECSFCILFWGVLNILNCKHPDLFFLWFTIQNFSTICPGNSETNFPDLDILLMLGKLSWAKYSPTTHTNYEQNNWSLFSLLVWGFQIFLLWFLFCYKKQKSKRHIKDYFKFVKVYKLNS